MITAHLQPGEWSAQIRLYNTRCDGKACTQHEPLC